VTVHSLGILWPWLVLALLGAYHGINPGMGWLFAVALGMQERNRMAVLKALPFLALGHEAAIAVVVAVVSGLSFLVNPGSLRIVGAIALIGFGLFKFLKPRSHPKWIGMRVTRFDLVTWSFLMSSAHGAGLMLLPVLLGLGNPSSNPLDDFPGISFGLATLLTDVAAVLIHTGTMLFVMAIVAVVVYETYGLSLLRRAWINLDRIWAVVVIGAGLSALFS